MKKILLDILITIILVKVLTMHCIEKTKLVTKLEKKLWIQNLCKLQMGPGLGLYEGVRGTAELVSALSDLYLDTETIDNVQKALPEIDLNDVYGEDAGGVAKFTSILTQYGTGFAVAQKIAKKLFGKACKNKTCTKSC